MSSRRSIVQAFKMTMMSNAQQKLDRAAYNNTGLRMAGATPHLCTLRPTHRDRGDLRRGVSTPQTASAHLRPDVFSPIGAAAVARPKIAGSTQLRAARLSPSKVQRALSLLRAQIRRLFASGQSICGDEASQRTQAHPSAGPSTSFRENNNSTSSGWMKIWAFANPPEDLRDTLSLLAALPPVDSPCAEDHRMVGLQPHLEPNHHHHHQICVPPPTDSRLISNTKPSTMTTPTFLR